MESNRLPPQLDTANTGECTSVIGRARAGNDPCAAASISIDLDILSSPGPFAADVANGAKPLAIGQASSEGAGPWIPIESNVVFDPCGASLPKDSSATGLAKASLAAYGKWPELAVA